MGASRIEPGIQNVPSKKIHIHLIGIYHPVILRQPTKNATKSLKWDRIYFVSLYFLQVRQNTLYFKSDLTKIYSNWRPNLDLPKIYKRPAK